MKPSKTEHNAEQAKKSASQRTIQTPANTWLGAGVSPAEIQAAIRDPLNARPQAILQLQRMAGNRAVAQLIQRKMMVGPANDPYEQEADRVAAQGLAAPATPTPVAQRALEDEEELQTKPLVQRDFSEDEELQTKPLAQRDITEDEELQAKSMAEGGAFAPSADFETRLAAQQSGGQPLPNDTRTFMESRFGADFGGVRIHADAQAHQLNDAIQAKAFTTGQDIYFREGAYQPGSRSGQELLAHELTHTIQQRGAQSQLGQRSTDGFVQRCIYPNAIGRGNSPRERLDKFIEYAKKMIPKAEKRAEDENITQDQSREWYESSDLFRKFIRQVEQTKAVDDNKISDLNLIGTLEDVLHRANLQYNQLKNPDPSNAKRKENQKEKKQGEKNEFITLINNLPDRSQIRGITNTKTVSKLTKTEILKICYSMIALRARLLDADFTAATEWAGLLNQLLAYLKRLSQQAPDQYVALLQCGVINVVRSLPDMLEQDTVCNEDLPKQIISCLNPKRR